MTSSLSSTSRPGRAARVMLVAAVLWVAGLLLLSETDAAMHLSNLGLIAVAAAAGAAALRQARRRTDATRRFWALLGAAALSWGSGQAVWTWYESVLGVEVPTPSLADLGYLGLPVLAAAGLLSLPLVAPTVAGRLRSILDGLLVASALLLCSWLLVLAPTVQANTQEQLQLAVTLAYPVGDVVVITMVLYTGLRSRQHRQPLDVPLAFVGSGLVAIAVSDSCFTLLTNSGSYTSGNLVDLGWFVGFALLLVAASDDDVREAPVDALAPLGGLAGNLLPYAAVGLALVVSVLDFLGALSDGPSDGAFRFWSRTVLVVLLVTRQVLTLSENQSLTRHLEQRVEDRTAELRASKERFQALVQHSSDLVTVVDPTGTVLYQSQSSERVLGYEADWLTGRSLLEVVDPAAAPEFLLALSQAQAEGPTDGRETRTVRSTWRHASGRLCQVDVTVTNLLDTSGVDGLVLNARDVTDRVALEAQLKHQAFIDSLTGLPNRALFRSRLQVALDRPADGAPGLTVLFLDLDGFKAVNDTLGHSAGDRLLVDVAQRLRSAVRSGDTVARFGGDEFAVLIEDAHDDGYGPQLAERIIDRLRSPFHIGAEEVYVSASIGIAQLDDPELGAEGLLRNADLAMYEAKADRNGGYSVYHPQMHEGLVERVRMEGDLRRAFDARQFFVHYQPIVDMTSGHILGVEALVRWQHPERGLVGPNEFIPLAEATGLIRDLGLWVLREACEQTVRWRSTIPGAAALRVSVNLSGQQVLQPDLVERVAQVLAETGLPADRLVLEMTESVLIDNSERTLAVLVALRSMGIRLALDDFGTGFSSLSYLHRFPIDTLKIDRSFVERLSTGDDAALIDTILALAASLDMETVAEGIEDLHQSLVLQGQGCTTGQGYHFSPPVAPATIGTMLLEQRWAHTPVAMRSDGTPAPVPGPLGWSGRPRTGRAAGRVAGPA